MWSPVIESAPWLVVTMLLGMGLIVGGKGLAGLSALATAQLCFAAGAARVGYAALCWSATWYVLTNRRVLDIRGLRRPCVTATKLVDISHIQLTASASERLLRLGTITFTSNRPEDVPWAWHHVANAPSIHQALRRAIKQASN